MDRPRVLIAMHYLEIGGAETALTGLLNAIDLRRCKVDLFLYSHRGELMASIPEQVNLLPQVPAYAQIEAPLKQVLRAGWLRIAAARLKARLQARRYARLHPLKESAASLQLVANAVTPLLPPVNPDVEYDLAVSFLTPHNIVRDKIRAKKKACWIHTDYSAVDVNAALELPVWAAFDTIVSVSDDVTAAFAKTFPSLESRIVKIENILSPALVRQKAEEFDAAPELSSGKGIALLSVGRFSYPKNFDNVPDICRRVVESGITDVRWYIIGYGPDEQLIRKKIIESGMQGHVILLGKRSNPYPYIKACDIYVQPSRYEGKSVTVREAQILCKPAVVADYPTVHSQVIDGRDGVIAPQDNRGFAGCITSLINDAARQRSLAEYLGEHDYGNESEAEKFYKLI